MAVWKEHDFWKYEIFERDIEPEILPEFQDLVRLWQKKRGNRPVPAWSDFDFHDFTGWHGRIVVADIFYDPFNFRYRLFGEEVAKLYQFDCTGKLCTELENSVFDPAEDLEFYEMTSRRLLISRVSGMLYRLDRPYVNATFVEFPLSDTGEMATHSLAAMI